ncbi:MAG TPA: hypothetical protein VIA80_12620 [Hyphomonadaceae bacterium]|jgi:hypothetical protein
MIAYRITAAVLGLVLAGAILWASLIGVITEEGGAMLALPWGIVTFIDLYLGFFFAASLILMMEPSRPLAIVLAVLVLVLGNVVVAAWAAWRAPLLWSRLKAQPEIAQPKAL